MLPTATNPEPKSHVPTQPKIKISRNIQSEKFNRSMFSTLKRGSRQVTEVFLRGKQPKNVNAQRLSPVMRWAFYTVACTALCGPIAQRKLQVLPCGSHPCK